MSVITRVPMSHRERILRTFEFKRVDRTACDLMEGQVWKGLAQYFELECGLHNDFEVFDFLDTDCRWVFLSYNGPSLIDDPTVINADADILGAATLYALRCSGIGFSNGTSMKDMIGTYSDDAAARPLKGAETLGEVDGYPWVDPSWWQVPDFAAVRNRWPDHALVLHPGWFPLFCGAANAFGMEDALIRMIGQPKLLIAFLEKQHAVYMDILQRAVGSARGKCDICWLGDDYASQDSMLFSPELWRRYIKPFLKEQVDCIRDAGMHVLFHSCGAVRAILEDLIGIGVDGLLVFQTTASGMDAQSISRDFGGRMVFYGGIDCQRVLTSGSLQEVRSEVDLNRNCFSKCGGYIVANTHHGVDGIRGANIVEMCRAAHDPF